MEAISKIHGGPKLQVDYHRIAERRGKNKARVAVARKLLTLVYYGLRDGEIRCLRQARPHEPAGTRPDARSLSACLPPRDGETSKCLSPPCRARNAPPWQRATATKSSNPSSAPPGPTSLGRAG